MNKKPFVIVGMSGGVDSSVAALLLQQQGYRVEGLFMKNWEDDDNDSECTAEQDHNDAKAVADAIGIPLHFANFAKEYRENVFAHFISEYKAGRTPNPDILCNREIKFKSFLNYAKRLGCDLIATGHYVRKSSGNEHPLLLKGTDNNKDQSYFLHLLTENQIAQSLFPLGEIAKPEVRKIATEFGLPTFAKKDSTGICFIGQRNFREFLSQYIDTKPGPIKTPEGELIGEHVGLSFYTLGQRQGLGIGGLKTASEEPWYVVAKINSTNTLIAAQGGQHPLLMSTSLIADKPHWVAGKPPERLMLNAKTRYRQPDQACEIVPLESGQIKVNFSNQQRAVTPGQAVVFYESDTCLGGATILETTH